MTNEFIIRQGIIVGRTAGAAITVVPTENDASTITFDDRSVASQTAEIKFNHATNTFTLEVGGVIELQATNTGVTIPGDLTVNGTTTSVNSTDLEITDNIITINKGETGTGVANGTGAAGIVVDRGLASFDAGWFFNEVEGWWGPTGPTGVAGEGGATQSIGNVAVIDSTDAAEQVLTFGSTGAFIPPAGTTGQRPATPSVGMTRRNSTLSLLEIYDGAEWAKILATAPSTTLAVTGDIDLSNTYKLISPLDPVDATGVGDQGFNDGRYLLEANNLSDLVDDATARTNLDVYSKAEAVAVAGDTMAGDLNMAADILPDVDFTTTPRDIGKTNGVDGAGADLRFRAMHAETFHGTATEALYADLAERYEADREYESGTVLIFGGEAEVTTTLKYADTRVAGVVSTNPAFKMNSDAGFSDTHPYIALKGKVPCKIVGPVRKGDLIMTSDIAGYGTAVKHGATKPYTAFARANENSTSSMSVINVSII